MPPRLPAPPRSGPAPRRSFLEAVLADGPSRRSPLDSGPAEGSPEDVLRRATTAYENKQAQAEALGVEGNGTGPKGFLEAVAGPLSVLDLPRAAAFATLTGSPTRTGEHRGFGDLGPLKVDADDSVLERGAKGAAAFAGDVATDPLTYLTFGIGPIGKKALSRLVSSQTRSMAARLSDDAIRRWADDALRFRGTSKIRQVAEEVGDDTARQVADQYDELAAKPPATWRGTPDEWSRHLGEQQFAGAATESFQQGGSTGLRRFLRTELGDEAGEAAFDELPLDVRGGPRLRVPFAKDDRGIAKTLPLAGDETLQGGGRLTESLLGPDAARRFEDVHRLRNRARSSKLGSLVADRFTGDPQGRLYGQMVADLYRQGDDEGLDRVTWSAYEAVKEAEEAATATSRRLRNDAAMVLGRVEQMIEGAGDEAAQGRARDLFVERFNDPARSRETVAAGSSVSPTGEPLRFTDAAGDPERVAWYEGLDDVERRAVSAAVDVHRHFESQLAQLRDAGMEVNEVRDYVARILTEDEKLRRERRKPVRRSQQQGGKQGSTDPTGTRQKDVDGDLVVGPDGDLHLELRWRTPEEINDLHGRERFVTDPTQIVAKYADAVSRATAKVQFANLVNEAGVTVPGGVALRRSVQEARVGRAGRAVEEQGRVAKTEAEHAREVLEEDLAEARRVEAAAKGRQAEARERAASDDAVARAADRAASGAGLLDEPGEGWVRLWRAESTEQIESAGSEAADDLRGRWFFDEEEAARGYAEEAARSGRDMRLAYVDVPERTAREAEFTFKDGRAEYVLPREVVALKRPAPLGPVDGLLSRPRGEVIDEAGDRAVSEAEAELRRVAAEDRMAEFERRMADQAASGAEREARQAAGEFVFLAGERHRSAVVRGLFAADGEIELPNVATLGEGDAADVEALSEALHAAGFEQVDVRPFDPSPAEQFAGQLGGFMDEGDYLVDVWRPADETALEDLRRTFVDTVDEHLPDGWQDRVGEYARRLFDSPRHELRPSMPSSEAAAAIEYGSQGDRLFAETGLTLDGPIGEVAVKVRFLRMADDAGYDVRLEQHRSVNVVSDKTTGTGTQGSRARRKRRQRGIAEGGVQLEARQWAVMGGSAEARRSLARALSGAGASGLDFDAISLRKPSPRQAELLSGLVGEEVEGWPDDVDTLADWYGRLRADGSKGAATLADRVETALGEAGWRLESAAGEAALPAPVAARGAAYAIFEADELYPLNGTLVEFRAPGRPADVRRVERLREGGVRLVDPEGDGRLPLVLEPEVAEDATTLTVYSGGRKLDRLPVEGTEIRPLEAAADADVPLVWSAVREVADGPEVPSSLFAEGRTSPLNLDAEGAISPPTVDDVSLASEDARRVRNEARADVRGRYDDLSRRALEEGRLLPDDVEGTLNRNVVSSVEAGGRRQARQAGRLAERRRRAALRTRGTANAAADRATRAADRIDSTLTSIDRQIDRVASDRDALMRVTEQVLKGTPDVDQQQAAIGALMGGLEDFHARTSQLHAELVSAAQGQVEKRLAKARRAYSSRLAAEATREAGQAVRSQPVLDMGGDLLGEAGLQQVGQQKPLSGAPVTEGLASLPPELDVTWAPENLRLAVERFYQARRGDADVQRWIDSAYRPWFALFKAWATVGRGPGYHVRNLTSAHFNNWIGGVTAADHSLAGALLQARRQAVREVRDEAAETMARRLGVPVEDARARITPEVFEAEIESKLAERLGGIEVVDGLTLYDVHRMSVAQQVGDANRVLEGLSGALGEQSARDFVAGRTRANLFRGQTRAELNPVQRGVNRMVDNRWIRMSSGWGQMSEEYVRNAAFIQGLRRYGVADGGRSARLLSDGLHFDYQALTREERLVRSTFVPFYVWMRRNTPLQFRALFMSPGRYRAVIAANEGARHAFEDDEQDVVPEWMRETLGWGSTFTYGGNPIAVGVESPAIDLNRLLKVPESLAPSDVAAALGASGKELIGAMSPAVKAPVEQALGVDSFTGAEFNRSGVPAPWWYRALPDVVAPTRVDKQGQVRGSDARISALQDALPFLGLSDRVVPLTPQQRERAATNFLSLVAPVVRASTLNPRQVAGELRSRTERLDEQLKWGPGADAETLGRVAELLDEGWTPEQIRMAAEQGRL